MIADLNQRIIGKDGVVKEQRVDGSSIIEEIIVRCTLVAGKAGSWEKGK